jgi:hypothetical protein
MWYLDPDLTVELPIRIAAGMVDTQDYNLSGFDPVQDCRSSLERDRTQALAKLVARAGRVVGNC